MVGGEKRSPLLSHRVEEDGTYCGYSVEVVQSSKDTYEVILHEDGAHPISIEGDHSLEEAKALFCKAVICESADELVNRAFTYGFEQWMGIDKSDYKAEEGK